MDGRDDEPTAWENRVRAGRPAFGPKLQGMKLRLLAAAAGRAQEVAGRYRLGRALGSGASGIVCEAHDKELDRRVAIKLIKARGDSDVRRVIREAQLLASLSHPNVVQVFEVGMTDGQSGSPYVVMEFVEGVTLETWFAEARPWREVVAMMLQAARGLWAAHRAGIVHRDFKPANVLVGHDGRIRVADFGLARSGIDTGATASARPNIGSPMTLTPTGQTLGTPAYMAAECFTGACTPLSDQYALACVLFEGIFGRRLMRASSMEELHEALGREVALPRQPAIPRRLAALISRGLQRDPAKRHRDLGAFIDGLQRSARPDRRPALASIALFGVLFAGFGLTGGSAPAPCAEPPPAWTFASHNSSVVRGQLDDYEARWSSAWREACLSAEGALDAVAEQCLEGLRSDAAALAGLLPELEPRDHAAVAAGLLSLAPPEECAHPTAIIPTDAKTLSALREIQPQLSRLRALNSTAQIQAGRALSVDVLAAARLVDYPPLLAEVIYLHAFLVEQSSDYDEARLAYEEAYFVAKQAEIYGRAAAAAAALAKLVGFHLHDAERGNRWAEHAKSAYEAAGTDAMEQQSYLDALGLLAQREGDHARVEELARAQIAVHARRGRLGTAAHNTSLGLLGGALYYQGRLDEALEVYEEGIEVAAGHYGEGTVPHAGMIDNRANILRLQGRTDDALDAMREALRLRELALSADDILLAYSHFNIAQTLHDMGRSREGIPHTDTAIGIMEAKYGSSHPDLVLAYSGRGNMRGALGPDEREGAIADLQHAREIAVEIDARDLDWITDLDASISALEAGEPP